MGSAAQVAEGPPFPLMGEMGTGAFPPQGHRGSLVRQDQHVTPQVGVRFVCGLRDEPPGRLRRGRGNERQMAGGERAQREAAGLTLSAAAASPRGCSQAARNAQTFQRGLAVCEQRMGRVARKAVTIQPGEDRL